MSKSGSLSRRAALAACLILTCARSARAQQPDQPVASPAPDTLQFLSRADFQVALSALSGDDIRFQWDNHWAGSFDMLDYVGGRIGISGDYEAVLGNELRLFDPNQAHYTLEGFATGRINDTTEIAGFFHHLSRHLSDRPKYFAIAMNVVGARVLKRFDIDGTTLDIDVEGGHVIQHSFIDYTWIGELHLQVRHPVNQHLAVFGRAMGQWFATNGEVADHGQQGGGFLEAGVRIKGTAGTMELFAGVERRIDADQLDRLPKTWGLAGLRLVSR